MSHEFSAYAISPAAMAAQHAPVRMNKPTATRHASKLSATAAGVTGSMRASIGDVLASGGEPMVLKLLAECASIAEHAGYPLRSDVRQRFQKMLTTAGSKMTASMLRDIERGAAIEVEHVIGDMVARRSASGQEKPLLSALDFVYLQLKSYEARRLREG